MTECVKPLPKTRIVSLCLQWVRCGKPNCRCATSELHGPYHYLFWREDGRLRKRYVPKGEVEAVRAVIAERREFLWLEREARKRARAVWREQAGEIREYERWMRRR